MYKIFKDTFKAMASKINDVYAENGVSKEWKGQDSYGNDIFGYPHLPELFVKSDVSGMMCRNYVTMHLAPNGFVHSSPRNNTKAIIFHPNELFDIAQRKVNIIESAF